MKRIMSCVIILTMLSGCGKIAEFLKPKKIVVYKTTVRQIDNVQIAATYTAMIYEAITIYNNLIGGNVLTHITTHKWIYIPAATLGTAYLAYEYLPLKKWYDETTKFLRKTQTKEIKGNQWRK